MAIKQAPMRVHMALAAAATLFVIVVGLHAQRSAVAPRPGAALGQTAPHDPRRPGFGSCDAALAAQFEPSVGRGGDPVGRSVRINRSALLAAGAPQDLATESLHQIVLVAPDGSARGVWPVVFVPGQPPSRTQAALSQVLGSTAFEPVAFKGRAVAECVVVFPHVE